MPLILDADEIETLRWVLRCYLADRPLDAYAALAERQDVREMLAASARDHRAVRALLARLDAQASSDEASAARRGTETRAVVAAITADRLLPMRDGARRVVAGP